MIDSLLVSHLAKERKKKKKVVFTQKHIQTNQSHLLISQHSPKRKTVRISLHIPISHYRKIVSKHVLCNRSYCRRSDGVKCLGYGRGVR